MSASLLRDPAWSDTASLGVKLILLVPDWVTADTRYPQVPRVSAQAGRGKSRKKEEEGTGYTPRIWSKPSNQVLAVSRAETEAGSQTFPSVVSPLRGTCSLSSMQMSREGPSAQRLCCGNFVLDSVRVVMEAGHVVCLSGRFVLQVKI